MTINVKYYLACYLLLSIGCSSQEASRIIDVGAHQLPPASASTMIKQELNAESDDTNKDKSTPVTPALPALTEPSVNYNLQTPFGPGLDALPTLVIPSPSGNKIVILPPPSR